MKLIPLALFAAAAAAVCAASAVHAQSTVLVTSTETISDQTYRNDSVVAYGPQASVIVVPGGVVGYTLGSYDGGSVDVVGDGDGFTSDHAGVVGQLIAAVGSTASLDSGTVLGDAEGNNGTLNLDSGIVTGNVISSSGSVNIEQTTVYGGLELIEGGEINLYGFGSAYDGAITSDNNPASEATLNVYGENLSFTDGVLSGELQDGGSIDSSVASGIVVKLYQNPAAMPPTPAPAPESGSAASLALLLAVGALAARRATARPNAMNRLPR